MRMLTVKKALPLAGLTPVVPGHCSAARTVMRCWSPTRMGTPIAGATIGGAVTGGCVIGGSVTGGSVTGGSVGASVGAAVAAAVARAACVATALAVGVSVMAAVAVGAGVGSAVAAGPPQARTRIATTTYAWMVRVGRRTRLVDPAIRQPQGGPPY